MLDFEFWMGEGEWGHGREEGREEKGRPRIEEDWGRCFCCDVTRRSKGGGASAVGGGKGRKAEETSYFPKPLIVLA